MRFLQCKDQHSGTNEITQITDRITLITECDGRGLN